MRDTKLIRTLKTFTKEEIKSFEKFAASPFFNNGRNYMPLLNELKKFHPGFEKENLTSENIYKKIYPGRKFNKQVMWNLVSELEKLAFEFLFQTGLKNKKLERFVVLFEELSNRHLNEQISKEIEKINKYSESVKLGKNYFYTKWIIENNEVEYWTSLMGRQDKSIKSAIKSAEYLLLNFLSDLSIEVSDLQIMKRMYNSKDEISRTIELIKNLDLKSLVEHAKSRNYEHSDLMMFYYNKIMSSLNEDDDSYFFEMKKYFDDNFELFEKAEMKNTIISLANYCAHKMRLGNRKYLKLLFEINKVRLEKEADIYQNRIMEKSLYHQIVGNALSLNEIEWTENFVREYTPKLKKEHQKTMSSLAMGYIHYTKKEYNKSLNCLNKVEFIDIRDKLHVRILSAKAYYELDKTELLGYYIDSSKHFIGSLNGIESSTKSTYMKFFNYLHRLLVCKENSSAKKLKSIREDIEIDEKLRPQHKDWLLKKTDKLISPSRK